MLRDDLADSQYLISQHANGEFPSADELLDHHVVIVYLRVFDGRLQILLRVYDTQTDRGAHAGRLDDERPPEGMNGLCRGRPHHPVGRANISLTHQSLCDVLRHGDAAPERIAPGVRHAGQIQ